MGPFGSAEPLVGEVLALRTFRVDDTGLLLPLFSELAWVDGVNTAVCAPTAGKPPRAHDVVSPSCRCGFYAYGSVDAVAEHTQSRRVLAVVSCWGRVLAGTQGVRAEFARVVGIWIGPSAPEQLLRRVSARYPSAQLYAERDAMLAAHPPTALPSYTGRKHRSLRAIGSGLSLLPLLALGLVPQRLLSGPLHSLWTHSMVMLAVLVVLAFGTRSPGRAVVAVVSACASAWLLAPRFDWAGSTLLRAPLALLALIAVVGLARDRRRSYFPVVRASRRGRLTS